MNKRWIKNEIKSYATKKVYFKLKGICFDAEQNYK